MLSTGGKITSSLDRCDVGVEPQVADESVDFRSTAKWQETTSSVISTTRNV